MKWYGILALVFSLFLLAGIVYAGANTDKVGFMLIPTTFATPFNFGNSVPQQIDEVQNYVKKTFSIQESQNYVKTILIQEDILPCQQIAIDWYDLMAKYAPGTKLSDIEVDEYQHEYEDLMEKRIDCEKYSLDWRTPEFMKQLEPMAQKMQDQSDAYQKQKIDEYRQKTQFIGDFFWKEVMAYDKNQAKINNDCNAMSELYDQVSKDLLEVSYNDEEKRTVGIPWSTARDTLQNIEKTYFSMCNLEESKIDYGSNSHCGAGTVFDVNVNSCVLK